MVPVPRVQPLLHGASPGRPGCAGAPGAGRDAPLPDVPLPPRLRAVRLLLRPAGRRQTSGPAGQVSAAPAFPKTYHGAANPGSAPSLPARCCFFHRCCLARITTMGCRPDRKLNAHVTCEGSKPRCEKHRPRGRLHQHGCFWNRVFLCMVWPLIHTSPQL